MSNKTRRKRKLLRDNSCSDSCDSDDCCDCCDVQPITECFEKMKKITNCVFECLDCRPSQHRELKVAFCILLTEVRDIENKLCVINDKLNCMADTLCKLADPCREKINQESVLTTGPSARSARRQPLCKNPEQ